MKAILNIKGGGEERLHHMRGRRTEAQPVDGPGAGQGFVTISLRVSDNSERRCNKFPFKEFNNLLLVTQLLSSSIVLGRKLRHLPQQHTFTAAVLEPETGASINVFCTSSGFSLLLPP